MVDAISADVFLFLKVGFGWFLWLTSPNFLEIKSYNFLGNQPMYCQKVKKLGFGKVICGLKGGNEWMEEMDGWIVSRSCWVC